MNEQVTEYSIRETVKIVAKEILDYYPEATDVNDVTEAIFEQADSLVNPYYYACAQEWLAVGMPNSEEQNDTDIHALIAYNMHQWYADHLIETLTDMLEEKDN